jgi:hypothetical protein
MVNALEGMALSRSRARLREALNYLQGRPLTHKLDCYAALSLALRPDALRRFANSRNRSTARRCAVFFDTFGPTLSKREGRESAATDLIGDRGSYHAKN